MNTIKLNGEDLENICYELAANGSEVEETEEEFNILYGRAMEESYLKYKKEFKEDPDSCFDPDFSEIMAVILPKILIIEYEEFYIEEETDKRDEDYVKLACFYAVKNGEKHILIKNVTNLVYK